VVCGQRDDRRGVVIPQVAKQRAAVRMTALAYTTAEKAVVAMERTIGQPENASGNVAREKTPQRRCSGGRVVLDEGNKAR
jgi:hypothetical protein